MLHFDENPDPKKIKITTIHNLCAYVDWQWPGFGFGQLSFDFDVETGILKVDSEMMGHEATRALLAALAEKIKTAQIVTDRDEWEARQNEEN